MYVQANLTWLTSASFTLIRIFISLVFIAVAFPVLADKMKAVMQGEMEVVVKEEK